MAPLKLFNTLTRTYEVFKPLKGKKVGLYTCGPTVYNFAHIGNLRTYIFADILKRTLYYNGYTVRHIMNITDVGHLNEDRDFGEDKIEQSAKTLKKTPKEIAQFYTKAFLTDIKKLNILHADKLPRASAHIKEQINIIKKLIKKGYAYETDLAVYFNVSKFKRYFEFSKQKERSLKQAAREDIVVDKNKKHPVDFALWFKRKERYKKHALWWHSPWGDGFPGWHIECSAMSTHYLGQPFDIHTGGIDHIFPHHTNEIAQSECAQGKQMARFWLHAEFLLINNARMGKSEKNFIRLADLEKKNVEPLAYRYFVLSAHYQKKLNFTFEALNNASFSLKKLRTIIASLQLQRDTNYRKMIVLSFRKKIYSVINNNLNTPQLLALLWDELNTKELYPKEKLTIAFTIDEILGLNLKSATKKISTIPTDVQQLVKKRRISRQNKNWKEADSIRAKILELGWNVEDKENGETVVTKNEKII